jgi:formate dehydrogenase major subunit
MTDKTPGLNEMASKSFIEMNTEDAEALGIQDGEIVAVSSRRGAIQTKAVVAEKTSPGECWMPLHFFENGANWLTNNALDDISSTPEYKVCAVRIEKIS